MESEHVSQSLRHPEKSFLHQNPSLLSILVAPMTEGFEELLRPGRAVVSRCSELHKHGLLLTREAEKPLQESGSTSCLCMGLSKWQSTLILWCLMHPMLAESETVQMRMFTSTLPGTIMSCLKSVGPFNGETWISLGMGHFI